VAFDSWAEGEPLDVCAAEHGFHDEAFFWGLWMLWNGSLCKDLTYETVTM
jgi:hypothetical protein